MRRRWFVFLAVALFVLGLWILDARLGELVPSQGGRRLAHNFLSAALHPAFDYEDSAFRGRAEPFVEKVATAAWLTVRYAVVAMSLALVFGIIGGVLGSRAWWSRRSKALQAVRLLMRLWATALRSVHELIWAILFLAAVGTSPLAAILAMALPYGGTLAKVFSELLDEADDGAAEVMRSAGGRGSVAFLGTVTTALPDLLTYAMYRLECAIRSSAVLGFVGVPTLGYEIKVSFEDGHYREIWTYLFALLVIVLFFEWWGGRIRKVMVKGVASRTSQESSMSLSQLWKNRGQSWFLRVTGLLVVALVIAGWLWPDEWGSGLSLDQRWANLKRFGTEIIPYPIQQSGDWREAGPWLSALMQEKGWQALWRTFHLGTASILLAGAVALAGMIASARSLGTATPRGIRVARSSGWPWLGKGARLLAILGRSAPEYLLAFLLLQIFGPTMWALILALAVHNSGILSRLGSEVIDNNESRAAEVLLASGGSRGTAFFGALLPEGFNRLVLFLFYRWETCIREATILGMLGVSSLGFLISEARVSFYYDELMLWVILGASLVFAGDLLSDYVRARLKK